LGARGINNEFLPIMVFEANGLNMKDNCIYKNLSELKKGDLFTHRLEQFNTVYYEFINFDREYYRAKIFQKNNLIKYRDDIIVMVVGKVSIGNQFRTKDSI